MHTATAVWEFSRFDCIQSKLLFLPFSINDEVEEVRILVRNLAVFFFLNRSAISGGVGRVAGDIF